MLHAITMLLVDDDPGDIELTREVLKQAKLLIHVEVAEDGRQALSYLRKEGPYAAAKDADLILLDLNMPIMDGRELLGIIKKDDRLKLIPVVVLTTSSAEEEIARSYGLGANCYVTKPVGLEQFSRVVLAIQSFWLTVVKLPPHPNKK